MRGRKEAVGKQFWNIIGGALVLCLVGVWGVGCSSTPLPSHEKPTARTEPTAANTVDAGPDAGTSEPQTDAGTTSDEPATVPESAPEFPPTKPFPPIKGGTVLEDLNPDPNVVEVRLVARQTRIKLSDTIQQIMYTYNGSLPGPIIRARVGNQLIVHFENALSVPTTIHWHGVRVPDTMDGTPRVQTPIQPGKTFTYKFTLKDAGSFWYHPHVRSNEQVELGLYGMLVVQEKENVTVTRERAVILDDIYIVNGRIAPFMRSHPEIMHGRNGNYLLMHGKLEPLQIQAKTGEVERWRVVNVSNARTMRLQFSGMKVRVVGVDGGLLAKPYYMPVALEVAVGQRYDLEVTYEKPGDYQLAMLAPASGGQTKAYPMVEVKVSGDAVTTPVPAPTYPAVPALPERKVDREVKVTFDAVQTNDFPQGVAWRLNGRHNWKEPIFTFKQGETVLMRLQNLAGQEHPFHLHGQFFEVLERNGKKAFEPGLKDSVLVNGMETVLIRAYLDNPGRWMIHCHILEHAELGMMAEILVE